MNVEKNGETIDKMIDVLAKKVLNLDDICWEILFTLMAKKELRTNQLYRSVIRFSSDISKPAFHNHLKHLIAQGLIERKEQDPQNVTYGLTKESQLAMEGPQNMSEIMQILEDNESLKPADIKEEFRKFTEKELDQLIDDKIRTVLSLNLHELKAFVQYELKTSETMTNRDFWKFVGNPMYRMVEGFIVGYCRLSDEYKKRLFERIDSLVSKIRSDETIFKDR